MPRWEWGAYTVAALLAAWATALRPFAMHSLDRRQESPELEIDARRILGNAGEMGHHPNQLDLRNATDGVQECFDSRREQALAVHPAVDLEVHATLEARAPELRQDRRHVVAHHREVHALMSHLLVLVETVERAHDQDHSNEAGVAQRHGFFGGRDRHSVCAGRHHRPGDGQRAVAVTVGLHRDEQTSARAQERRQVGYVASDSRQIYQDAAARGSLHRPKRLTQERAVTKLFPSGRADNQVGWQAVLC